MGSKPTHKVIIGMPCTDIVRARTAHALGCLIIGAKGAVVDFLLRQSCEIASARTWLVNEAINKGATHLLFVDSDICPFGEDTILKMLAHEKPILAAEYNMRKFPLEPVFKALDQRDPDKPYKARYAGTGLMLIDLSIFKDPKFGIREDGTKVPWFSFGRDSQGALALGEDAWFCSMAREFGYDTWIDPTIKVAHVGEYLF